MILDLIVNVGGHSHDQQIECVAFYYGLSGKFYYYIEGDTQVHVIDDVLVINYPSIGKVSK